MGSILGSILGPAADKALMTTLVVTPTIGGSVPRMSAPKRPFSIDPPWHVRPHSPTQCHNLGEGRVIEPVTLLDMTEDFDSARKRHTEHFPQGVSWLNRPSKKTFQRCWDFSLPFTEVQPTLISKVRRS